MSSIFVVLVSLGALARVGAADQQKSNTTTVRQCYVCTSAISPACADVYNNDNKFPHEKIVKEDFSRDCSSPDLIPYYDKDAGEKPLQAVGCRKILQEVDSATRVVRQCAYNAPEGVDEVNGLKRTGNQGVRLFYYQCSKDNCNAATSTGAILFVSLFVPVILALIARW